MQKSKSDKPHVKRYGQKYEIKGLSRVLATTASLVRNWHFAKSMAVHELKNLTRGAFIGLGWLVLRPIVLAIMYVVIVSFVFNAQLGAGVGRFDYALHVLSGLVVWQASQQILEAAPNLLRERMEFVRQLFYPIETIPVSYILSVAPAPVCGLAVFIVTAALAGKLSPTVLLLPIPIALLILFCIGISWLLMEIGLLLRDLRDGIATVLGLLVYFSPVLATEAMVGKTIWTLMLFNPLAHIVICFRDVLLNQWHPESWIIFTTTSVACYIIGAHAIHGARQLLNDYL